MVISNIQNKFQQGVCMKNFISCAHKEMLALIRDLAKLNNFNVQLLEVVTRYRNPQPQAVENHSYLFKL